MDRRLLRFRCGYTVQTASAAARVSPKKLRNYERERLVVGRGARERLRRFYDVFLPAVLRDRESEGALLAALIPEGDVEPPSSET